MSRWFRYLRGDGVAKLPRVEDLSNLIGQGEYVEHARVTVFEDLDKEGHHRDVLVVVGDRWTILDGDAFKRLAERLLPQL